MSFSPTQLYQVISKLPQTTCYWVAYSGGLDSHVLLHALADMRSRFSATLRAIHVDHGIQAASRTWAAHCADTCERLGVPCDLVRVTSQPTSGDSLEAWARRVRYRAFTARVGRGEFLLTAHHRDDQAETVLLQLLRGAGPSGLAAMPLVAAMGSGYQVRPLLDFTRRVLVDYARKHRLEWIEDTSNEDIGLDRNYLRNRVIPILSERWPALSRTLARSARHCAEAQELIDTMARKDMNGLLSDSNQTLSVSGLAALPSPRARAVVRYWVKAAGFPIPDTARLERLLREMIGARRDRNPLVHWPGAEVRRYRDRLYLMSPLTPVVPGYTLDWTGRLPLDLPDRLGRLETVSGVGGIARNWWAKGRIQVRFGLPAGRLRPVGQGHSQTFKNFFQQRGVPPWQRPRIPLIFIGDTLAAVGDLCVCEPCGSVGNEKGVVVCWRRP